jgi:hypothetical protein
MNATFRRDGLEGLKKVMNSGVITIACDIALPLLSELRTPPTFVVSVDSHPVVANFYRRSQNILQAGVTPLLSTTIHRDVVDECHKAGAKVRWIQGFPPKPRNPFFRQGATFVVSGGNVATTSYIIGAMAFGCRPIGLFGIECAWSDETPYYTVGDFNGIARAVQVNPRKAIKSFKKIHNRRDGKTYVVDYTYYQYRRMFRELWSRLPPEVRRNTYNLTKQGILSAKDLRYMNLDTFLSAKQK